ncbi:MAG: ligase-associated DNA damage response exonuclease [Phycisphaerales bacterium JB060]
MARTGTPPPLVSAAPGGLAIDVGGGEPLAMIDPWRPAKLAIITHAHADHAYRGSERYLCSASGAGVLRTRMGKDAVIEGHPYGEPFRVEGEGGAVEVTFFPAGHVLGSAQVRVRVLESEQPADDRAWVVTGDCNFTSRAEDPNPTCARFQPVACDVLLIESTFGLPIYRWPDPKEEFARLNEWWRTNAANGRTSIVMAYGLGKSQRVLAGLDPSIGPIGVHGAIETLLPDYRAEGVELPEVVHTTRKARKGLRGVAMIIAPPGILGSPWLRSFGSTRTSMASGFMLVRGRRRWRSFDHGCVISDHADWPGLLGIVEASGAKSVGVTHGASEPLARYLAETRGLETFVVPTRYRGEAEEETAVNEAGEGE